MSNTAKKLTRLGVPVPKAIQHADEIRSRVYFDVLDPKRDVSELLVLLKDGNGNIDELRKVMADLGPALAAASGFETHRDSIVNALDAGERAALVACSGEVFDSLRPRVVELGQLLSDALGILGPTPDHVTVSRMGPKAGTYWSAFSESLQALQQVWSIVCDVYAARRTPAQSIPRAIWIELTDAVTLDDIDVVNSAGTVQAIAAIGRYTITLNRPDVTSKFIDGLKRRADADAAAAA